MRFCAAPGFRCGAKIIPALFDRFLFTIARPSAIIIVARAPVAQWIEHQIPVLRVGGSSPFRRATAGRICLWASAALNCNQVRNRYACVLVLTATDLMDGKSPANSGNPELAGLSVSKNLFDTLAGYQESSEYKKLAPVGVHRYGRARVPK